MVVRQGGKGPQQLQRHIDPGRLHGQKRRAQLGGGGDRHGKFRRGSGAVRGVQSRNGQLPPDGRGDAGLRQGGQGLPAQGVDGAGGEGEPLVHGGLHTGAAVAGAAGLSKAGLQLLRRQAPGAGRFRHGARDRDGVAVRVGGGEGAGGSRGTGDGKMHVHRPGSVLFIEGTGLGKELLGLRGVFRPGAEHARPVAALPVPVRKAGAGERLLQAGKLFLGGAPVFLQQPGVHVRHHGHILRPLHAALQLQAVHAHGGHVRDLGGKAAVFETQGIALARRLVDAVGQAAGLGAAAPVAGAAAQHGAHGALAGIAHAKGAVGEDLHLRRAGAYDGLRVLPGALPGQHHPLAAVGGHLAAAAGGKEAHLGAGVEGQVRQHLAQQVKKAPVLHQHGIHAQAAGLPGRLGGTGQLPVTYEGVEGQKHPYAPLVAVCQGLGKLLVGKILGAAAGVEFPPPKVHGAGARLDGGAQGFRGPGGGQKLGHLHPC